MKSRLTNGTIAAARGLVVPSPAGDESNELVAKAVDQSKAAAARLEQVIKSYPVAFLAAATAAGVLLGWWVKRK